MSQQDSIQGAKEDFNQKLLSYAPMIWKMARRLFPSGNTDDSISTKNQELQRDLVQASYRRALEKQDDIKDGFVNWLRGIVLAEFQLLRTAQRHWPSEDIDEKLSNSIEKSPDQEIRLILSETIDKAPYPKELLLRGLGFEMEEIANEFGVSRQVISKRMKRNMESLG